MTTEEARAAIKDHRNTCGGKLEGKIFLDGAGGSYSQIYECDKCGAQAGVSGDRKGSYSLDFVPGKNTTP